MADSGSVQDRLERDWLNDLIDELAASATEVTGSGASKGIETGRVAQATCGHACAEHVALMNPDLWSTLPKEVLYLVFARLPMPNIMRLQCLSKEWKWNVTAKESDFRRTCASTKPSTKLFAMCAAESWEYGMGFFSLYDANADRWHVMDFRHRYHSALYGGGSLHPMSVSDGGLVCFYMRSNEKGQKYEDLILVGNPLTNEWKTLTIPSNSLDSGRPRMLQLVMDRDRKYYKVIVVGYTVKSSGAIFYNSATGTWSSTSSLSDIVFGYDYKWRGGDRKECFDGFQWGPCAFDCREGKLLAADDRYPIMGNDSYVLVRDRLFVFHEEGYEKVRLGRRRPKFERYCISEYQGHVDSTGLLWVKVKVHSCGPDFEKLPKSCYLRFQACEGFLWLGATSIEAGSYGEDFVWLNDMSVEKWRRLLERCKVEYFEHDTVCELRWDAVP